ncbi:MAG: preprotein translocase subunit YajC [Treponema sp.]|nr:preprotein translocase subunit YajC [Treponema sp.]
MATPDAGGGGAGGNALVSFVPFILIIGIFYFLIIRPQNKKQKETQKMLGALKKGDKIVTIGGIHGTIQKIKEASVIVRVDENTKMEFSRSAVSSVEAAAKEADDDENGEEKKSEEKKDEKGGGEKS